MLWTGSAGSAVDFTPHGGACIANGTDGIHQVGEGTLSAAQPNDHALLWSGTAGSVVDLGTGPAGFIGGSAHGVAGGQQVGFCSLDGQHEHATLWTGTVASVVDLHPTGFTDSLAYGTNGRQQVGIGTDATQHGHALVWSGTASSAIDLGSFLDPNVFSGAVAYSIDASGDIFGFAIGGNGNANDYPVEWVPVPEPSLGVTTISVLFVLAKRRRPASAAIDFRMPGVGPPFLARIIHYPPRATGLLVV